MKDTRPTREASAGVAKDLEAVRSLTKDCLELLPQITLTAVALDRLVEEPEYAGAGYLRDEINVLWDGADRYLEGALLLTAAGGRSDVWDWAFHRLHFLNSMEETEKMLDAGYLSDRTEAERLPGIRAFDEAVSLADPELYRRLEALTGGEDVSGGRLEQLKARPETQGTIGEMVKLVAKLVKESK